MDQYLEYRIANYIQVIVPPILIAFGTIGNILTLIELMQGKNRNSSTSRFLIALAVSDIVILWSAMLVLCMSKYHQVFDFLLYTASQFSSWQVVCVTIGRVTAVCQPHQFKRLCKPRYSLYVIIFILLLLVLLNLHFLLVSNITEQEMPNPDKTEYHYFRINVLPWIDLFMLSLIPFLVLLLGNGCIIVKLTIYRNRKVHNSSAPRDVRNRTISKMTITMIILCAVHVVCTTPSTISAVYNKEWVTYLQASLYNNGSIFEYRATHHDAFLWLVFTIVDTICLANYAVNFILYFLSVKKFRQGVKNRCYGMRLKELFKHCRRRHENRVSVAVTPVRFVQSRGVANISNTPIHIRNLASPGQV